jgi:hypothetical protein
MKPWNHSVLDQPPAHGLLVLTFDGNKPRVGLWSDTVKQWSDWHTSEPITDQFFWIDFPELDVREQQWLDEQCAPVMDSLRKTLSRLKPK